MAEETALPGGLIEIEEMDYPATEATPSAETEAAAYVETGKMLFWNLNSESITLDDGTVVPAGELAMKNGRPVLVDGKQAIKAWIIKVLHTEKGRDEIYIHRPEAVQTAVATGATSAADGFPTYLKQPPPIAMPFSAADVRLEPTPLNTDHLVGMIVGTGETVRFPISAIPVSAVNLAATIHAATGKTTPVDADEVPIWNSVGSVLGKVTWANIKATLGSVYAAIAHTHAHNDTTALNTGDYQHLTAAELADAVRASRWSKKYISGN
jgi:hypothetical protein